MLGFILFMVVVLVIPKKSIFKYVRYTRRVSNLISKEKPPILNEGLLDNIVNNTVGFLLKKNDIAKYGVKVRRGVVLSGSPGNGKTMLCRWIQKLCKDYNIDQGTVTGGEIERAFAEGHNLDYLFTRHTVTFFDDIDINYLHRKTGDGRISCAILAAMDGVNQTNHLIRIFTTNEELADMDDAFKRPGRIDRCYTFLPPCENLRRRLVTERWSPEILDYLNTTVKHKKTLVDVLVERTDRFSFAEMEAIKSLMVTNLLMGTKEWDLEKAFEEFEEGKDTFGSKKGVGF